MSIPAAEPSVATPAGIHWRGMRENRWALEPPDANYPLVLIFAFFFPPATTAGAARPFRFFKYLRRFGYRPVIITGTKQRDNRTLPDVHFIPGKIDPDRHSVDGIKELVLRKWLLRGEFAITWASAASRAAAPILREHRVAAIVSTFPPLNSHLAAMDLQRRFRIPWIADFRDPLANHKQQFKSLVHKWVDAYLEARFLRRADILLANTEAVSEDWRRRYPHCQSRIHVLPNGFDPEEPIEPAPIPVRDRRVMVHVGAIYGTRGPGQLLDAAERLIARGRLNPAALQIRLIGPVYLRWLEIKQSGYTKLVELGCLKWLDAVDQPTANRVITEAEYLLLLDWQGEGAGLQLPSKVFDYVRVGRPILASTNRGSSVDHFLSRCGVPSARIYTDDRDDIVDQKILDFLALPTNPVTPSDWFIEEFDGIRQAKRLSSLISGISSPPG